MIIIPILFLLIIIAFQIFIIVWNNDLIDTQQRTISRMEVGIRNQMDREKELLEKIKYLESLELVSKKEIEKILLGSMRLYSTNIGVDINKYWKERIDKLTLIK